MPVFLTSKLRNTSTPLCAGTVVDDRRVNSHQRSSMHTLLHTSLLHSVLTLLGYDMTALVRHLERKLLG